MRACACLAKRKLGAFCQILEGKMIVVVTKLVFKNICKKAIDANS